MLHGTATADIYALMRSRGVHAAKRHEDPNSVRRTALATTSGKDALEAGAVPCSDGGGGLCGTVRVPIDWSRRSGRTLDIAYKLYVHTGSGEAVSAILPNFGGPGQGTMFDGDQGFVDFAFGPLRDRFDVLMIDNRGTGRSGAIDCPQLQHQSVPLADGAALCAAQLGPDVDKYGSPSVARDTEAIRRSLDIDKLDFLGVSYGTMGALAYAARYPNHTRSIVMGSGFAGETYTRVLAEQMATLRRSVTTLCAPTTSCGRTISDPVAPLVGADVALTRHPFTADGIDRFGNSTSVEVDGEKLADLADINDSNSLLNQGELPAALKSYRSGDRAPLARLATQTPAMFGLTEDAGDPAGFSLGALFAIDCADNVYVPWRNGLTVPQRQAVLSALAARVPRAQLTPFTAASVGRVTALDFYLCSLWPDTRHEAPIPTTSPLPDVPVLSFVGDLDSNAPRELDPATRFRHSQTIDVGAVPHAAVFYRCGIAQMQEFLVTQSRVSTSCDIPAPTWWSQAAFPRSASAVAPLAVGDSRVDRSSNQDRRLAGAVTSTVLDATMQWFRVFGDFTYSGLRGGTVTNTRTDSDFPIVFDSDRYVDDLAVSGTFKLSGDVNAGSGTVTAVGPNGVRIELTIAGEVGLFDRSGAPLTVTGTIDGRPVSLLAPTT